MNNNNNTQLFLSITIPKYKNNSRESLLQGQIEIITSNNFIMKLLWTFQKKSKY